jgi:hypothetical protein
MRAADAAMYDAKLLGRGCWAMRTAASEESPPVRTEQGAGDSGARDSDATDRRAAVR